MANTTESHPNKTIAVVGGGLGGALCACFFAKHGINVHLFELRPDIRNQKVVKGRSINMALSRRGRDALAYINCEDVIVRNGIPMRARMLHDLKCHTAAVPYGTKPEHEIISIDRRILNELLLDEACKYPEIKIHFQHKFVSWNPENKIATFQNKSGENVDFEVDALIGYDGCHSAVRAAMMKTDSVNFSQEFVESHYMEFCIPPKNGEFVMEKNYLHIWPRHDFMLIALPNQDKSFTTTLFLPLNIFQTLTTTDELLAFFQKYFPDAISFIGQEDLIETFFSSKPLPLVSIKCSPHVSTNGDILLMGDAAHSMVPFYAQGMNSAFEDALVLFDKLKQNNFQFSTAFFDYNKTRIHDVHAIVDLSMYNYREMSHLVTQTSFYWRKKVDNCLYRLIPNWWVPLYTMVTFTRIPYKQCLALRQRQDQVLKLFRLTGYSVAGLYLLQKLATFVIKPLAKTPIVQNILPRFAATK
ncbi:unnamed protein product [Rotaria socialis]|uniref:Kynurenine 3-monooxygenase n=1 Tax=Rotaria socialis TaxID=392032 RepID=A0A821AP82_9BILA|nr:unnamed protein product [Rotaria socialis]CAF3239455.1 unnamed protein product [Rotaria socialis]CAF3348317.1 unnamed protein product [Rotaria socialis]CAF3366426.1 unnamed protein product [Rotaria socialis]CAF4234560.1 unnamed protein product [Rotaria socialis]